jgi:hypothetical protein
VDTGARDQFGVALAPLAQYTVAVTVAPPAALAGVSARLINVEVTYPGNGTVAMTGFKIL